MLSPLKKSYLVFLAWLFFSILDLVFISSAQAQDNFTGLGDLAGGSFSSSASGVSADGSIVAGGGRSASGQESFRWTAGGGMVGLGDLAGGSFFSLAYDINADGSVIVGQSVAASGPEAFRWTVGGGMVGLGDLAGGSFQSLATGVSTDGSVVVGFGLSGSGREAFRWTSGGGMLGLGDLAGGSFQSRATGVSADGSVIVGVGNSAGGNEAFRWTSGGGMIGLGDLAGGSFSSIGNAVSADGSVVVGTSNSASGNEAFRWTSGGGMIGLGDLAGGSFNSFANAASADGSVVVGHGNSASGIEAFRWTADGGMVRVEDWLSDAGVATTGFSVLSVASDLSADGSVIVGRGISVNGNEAFLARVSSIGSGVLNVASVNQSLSQTQTLPAFIDSTYTLPLNGAHHRPLMLDQTKRNSNFCGWATVDGGYFNHDRDGYILSKEVGVCHDFMEGQVVLGTGIGLSNSAQDTYLEGGQEIKGQYGLIEANYSPNGSPLTLGAVALFGASDAEIERGYSNGGTPDISEGETDVTTKALKLSAHWDSAAKIGNVKFSPKTSYTVAQTKVDGYTETGGGFPVRFDDQDLTTHEARMGFEAETAFNNNKTVLRGTLEGVHRFDPDVSGVSGNLVGLFDFNIEGAQESETWGRVGLDLEHSFDNGVTLGSSMFASTTGVDPDISGALTIKVPFGSIKAKGTSDPYLKPMDSLYRKSLGSKPSQAPLSKTPAQETLQTTGIISKGNSAPRQSAFEESSTTYKTIIIDKNNQRISKRIDY